MPRIVNLAALCWGGGYLMVSMGLPPDPPSGYIDAVGLYADPDV